MYRNVAVNLWSSALSSSSRLPGADSYKLLPPLGPLTAMQFSLGRSPVQTLLSHSHLAKRVRGIDFWYSRDDVSVSMVDFYSRWDKFEDFWGREAILAASMDLYTRLLEACTTLSQVFLMCGPEWAFEALRRTFARSSLSSVNQRMRSLTLCSIDEDTSASTLVAIIAALPHLRHLYLETTNLRDLAIAEPIPTTFTTLSLTFSSLSGFRYFSSNSQSSLTHLQMQAPQEGLIDLSAFSSLVSLEIEAARPSSPSAALTVSPQWIPPLSAPLKFLALRSVSPHASALPTIPSTVQHLKLGLDLEVNPFKRRACLDYHASVAFTRLAGLLLKRPSLASIRTVLNIPRMIWEPAPKPAWHQLATACEGKGISLEVALDGDW